MNQISKLGLEPWNYFNDILSIPRASKKEEKIRSHLIQFAKKNALDWKTDDAGNLVIIKEATNKHSNKTIILQSHMDMVCEKDQSIIHDFENDPIQVEITDDWMKAKGTTLGADNGIGMAIQLAILSNQSILHPKLECLFTTDEETGLYGATNIQKDLLSGNTLINLDSEEEGEFCIGCAGGLDTLAQLNIETEETPQNYFFFEVKLSGLQGGHSGQDINSGRANAIKLLAEYLEILQSKTAIQIFSINGGNLRNAIPREAEAILAVPNKDKELVRIEINHFIVEIEEKYANSEKQFKFELGSTDHQEQILTKKITDNLISALNTCPNGAIEMNKKNVDLVETSTNLAAIHTSKNAILIETSQRSLSETKKASISKKVGNSFHVIGAKIEFGKDYPGWEPDFQSNIVKLFKQTYTNLFHKEPIVKTIHAGLECGILSKKFPNIEMISVGPTILNPHSPSEMVQISSVKKCWDLLIEVLKKL